MSDWLIYTIGFVAQLLFSSRLVVQWTLSEKSKRIVTPSLFWKLSLIASFLLFVYGYLRDDFAIMLGQSITYFIYIRNLYLQGEWQRAPKIIRLFLLLFPGMIVFYAYNNGTYDLNELLHNVEIPQWLFILGIGSQLIFTLRFIYQWIISEKRKTSQLPIGFWRLSILGASLILVYAIFRKDPVLFIGHLAGIIIYTRNILISKKQFNSDS